MFRKLREIYHLVIAYLGAVIYRHPSREIFVLGVTGTKGKSSVIELINAGLEAAGEKTAICSSLRFKIGSHSLVNTTNNTMPGRFFIQSFLRRAVETHCRYALLEVTSQGIVQSRHRYIDFDAAAIINLHPEHIESHGSFEKYRAAKLQFFREVGSFSHKSPKYFFVNKDDLNSKYFTEVSNGGELTFSGKSKIKTPLQGEFNQYNVGLAEAVLKKLGVKEEIIKKALANFSGIPGRLEFIQKKPFAVVVDYAHTPDSLTAVYKTLRDKLPRGKGAQMLCVLGSCGGGRDRWKRPRFGEIASTYCDKIILTNEDPYDEDPAQILREIKAGIAAKKIKATEEILERGSAIKRTIGLAGPGDIIVITGKGSEPFIHVKNGKRLSWSDKMAVLNALTK